MTHTKLRAQTLDSVPLTPAGRDVRHGARRLVRTGLSCLALLLPLLARNDIAAADAPLQTRHYAPATSPVLNPDRGFYDWIELLAEVGSGDQAPRANTDFGDVRRQGSTLAFAYLRLSAYRDSPLPDALVTALDTALAAVRRHGIRLVLRVAYRFPESGDDGRDATLARMRGHAAALAPLFERHGDVIAFLQAGLLGPWGEWHSTDAALDNDAQRSAVLDIALSMAPPQRFVQLRRPLHLAALFPDPLPGDARFGPSRQARVGHHNDCFLSSEDDVGTYFPPERDREFRDYVAMLGDSAPIGGETCDAEAAPPALKACDHVLEVLAAHHWTYLNRTYVAADIDRWRADGCYDEIAQRLGYRLHLDAVSLPASIQAGDELPLTLTLSNSGFARVYNPRHARLVAVGDNGDRLVLPLAQSGRYDARHWLPAPGERQVLAFSPRIPAAARPGRYRLYLALPDPSPTLAGDPRYAIALASESDGQLLWEGASGQHDLGVAIVLESQPGR